METFIDCKLDCIGPNFKFRLSCAFPFGLPLLFFTNTIIHYIHIFLLYIHYFLESFTHFSTICIGLGLSSFPINLNPLIICTIEFIVIFSYLFKLNFRVISECLSSHKAKSHYQSFISINSLRSCINNFFHRYLLLLFDKSFTFKKIVADFWPRIEIKYQHKTLSLVLINCLIPSI